MWDQERNGWDQGSHPAGSGITRDKDEAVPFLWDQGPKFVTLLETRIRNLATREVRKHWILVSGKLWILEICDYFVVFSNSNAIGQLAKNFLV